MFSDLHLLVVYLQAMSILLMMEGILIGPLAYATTLIIFGKGRVKAHNDTLLDTFPP